MKEIIVLLAIIACAYSSSWNFGDHDGHGLTLGEISLEHHDLGVFSLGRTDSHSSGDHSPLWNEVDSWLSGISGLHGNHIIPVVKHIGIPTVKKVPVAVPHPVVQTIPQPYPVAAVIAKPIPYEVEKPVFKTIEKKVPTPVEKIIPIKIEKPVPFHVVKYVPVPVVNPIPIKIPIYKTIVHKVKGR